MIGLLALFAVAGALTSAWLSAVVVYVSDSVGWSNLLTLPPTDLAAFTAGAFGPMAALWLVVAYVQTGLGARRQEQILRLMAGQARRSSDQMESQVRTLIHMQAESRRRSVIDGMDLVLKDLNGQAAVLAERLGMISQDEADTLWARIISGDVWAFAYAFVTRADAYPEFPDLLAERLSQDDISTSALQIFLRRYDLLIDSFREENADKLVRNVLEDGPLARLDTLLRKVDQRALALRQARMADAEALAHEIARSEPAPHQPEASLDKRETLGSILGRESKVSEAAVGALAVEGASIEQSLARLQGALSRMNGNTLPLEIDSETLSEAPPADWSHEPDVGPMPDPVNILGHTTEPATQPMPEAPPEPEPETAPTVEAEAAGAAEEESVPETGAEAVFAASDLMESDDLPDRAVDAEQPGDEDIGDSALSDDTAPDADDLASTARPVPQDDPSPDTNPAPADRDSADGTDDLLSRLTQADTAPSKTDT